MARTIVSPKKSMLVSVGDVWNVLVQWTTAQEVAKLLQVCKNIRKLLFRNGFAMELVKSQQQRFAHAELVLSKVESGLEYCAISSRFTRAAMAFLSWADFWHFDRVDGRSVYIGPEHIIIKCDSYRLRDSERRLLNTALFLEHKLGKNVCWVQYWKFPQGTQVCLARKHLPREGKTCCALECHRGNVIFIRIPKDCCTLKFVRKLRPIAISEKAAFVKTHGICEEEDNSAKANMLI